MGRQMATTELSPGFSAAAVGRLGRRAFIATARAVLLDLASRCGRWSEAEAGRLALWTPVAIGGGAALYFSLTVEPPAWISLVCLAVAGSWRLFGGDRFRVWTGAMLFVALGFVAADWKTARVDAPILARELTPTLITGRLVSVDEAPKARRLVIDVASIDRVDAAALPDRVRVSWRGAAFAVSPGDTISLRAGLAPPPPPAAPGGFDFGRTLYFERIGAVGYAVTAPEKISAAPLTLTQRLSAYIERSRIAITQRILEVAPGQGGAIVAASVTGHRGAINDETDAVFRNSGLAHLIAISGLNMALATGLIFFVARGALAMIEPVALRYPIKKWAAGAALLSGFVYLLLSGGDWSALRAFIMTAIVFVAIIFDRRALSLRNVAIAATIIILIAPEAVMHPGFQMSFAAVTALIAWYEWGGSDLAASNAVTGFFRYLISPHNDPNRSFAPSARARRYIVAIAVTDVIAASATAPFSLYHFNQSANYGLPANVVAIPIMGFAVMPMAVVGLILMPFGLDGWAWRTAALGVEAIIAVGEAVASLPGAVATIAQWPPAALGVLVLGGLWLCLQSAPWRLAGLAAIPVAGALIIATPQPSLFISDEGENVGIVARSPQGEKELYVFNPRKDKFSASVWREQVGLNRSNAATLGMDAIGQCDRAGCAFRAEGVRIAVSRDPLALADDCRRADLVIALYPVKTTQGGSCGGRLIDRRQAWDKGAHAVWFTRDGFRVETVNGIRGSRPWSSQQGAADSGKRAGRTLHRGNDREVIRTVERAERN